MTTISGFTFIHNAISSGYPVFEAIQAVRPYVDEVVIVDMESTDNTLETLEKLKNKPAEYGCWPASPIKIIKGEWGFEAGETLRQAHNKYIECSGDVIVHFEADEVFDDFLIKKIRAEILNGRQSLSVYRLQLELNFQRCRWYPELVHRVFPRLSGVRKEGHTTNQHESAYKLMPKNGYLWDCTNCFRDNWLNRVYKQAQLRESEPQFLMTPLHVLHKAELTEAEAQKWIYGGDFWQWTNTPFNIPDVLKPLVGMVKYEAIL